MYGINRRTLLTSASCALAQPVVGQDQGSSAKKGFGIAVNNNPDWRERLHKIKAHWFYAWRHNMPEGIPAGIEYVPMIWGKWSCTESIMKQLVSEGHKAMLSFHKPEHEKQAGISIDKAIELWPTLMKTGIRIGSPACGNADGEWMDAFMTEVEKRGYRVDFITVHAYPKNNVKHFLQRLEKIHVLYKRPLWITELAVADWEAREGIQRYSPDDVYKFMETALPALEKLDYVERYAWYSPREQSPSFESSRLFNPDGSLSRLGELYASI